jgi:hypothetical protein
VTKKLKQGDLTPPDFARCQAEQNIYQPFVMGGRVHRTERCDSKPDFIAIELVPGKDGLRGSMSLCLACAKVMLENVDLRQRVQLQPIEVTPKKRKRA